MDLKCYGTPLLHLVLGISALPEGQDFGTKAFFHLLPLVDVSMKVSHAFPSFIAVIFGFMRDILQRLL